MGERIIRTLLRCERAQYLKGFILRKAVRIQESEFRMLKPVKLHIRLGDICAHPAGEYFRDSNDTVTGCHSEF